VKKERVAKNRAHTHVIKVDINKLCGKVCDSERKKRAKSFQPLMNVPSLHHHRASVYKYFSLMAKEVFYFANI
jgi:hypothetical protein